MKMTKRRKGKIYKDFIILRKQIVYHPEDDVLPEKERRILFIVEPISIIGINYRELKSFNKVNFHYTLKQKSL